MVSNTEKKPWTNLQNEPMCVYWDTLESTWIFIRKVQSAKILLLPPKCEIIFVTGNGNFANIAIAILDFSLLLLVKLTLLIRDSNIGLFSIAPCFASFLVSVLCFFFDGSLSKVIAFPSCRSFSLLKAIAKRLPLLIAIAKLEEQ